MKMSDKKIKWLFFDLGSTLVDETECAKKRCDVIIENSNIDKDEFYAKVTECAKTDSYAVKAAAQYYGAEIPRWFGELERLYPDTVTILNKLSKKYKLGMKTVWVRQGFARMQQVKNETEKPDYIIENIGDIPGVFG